VSLRPAPVLVLLAAACLIASGCGGSASNPSQPAASHDPRSAPSLAERLVAADAALRRSLGAWRAADPGLRGPPPQAALTAAGRERAIVHLLAGNRALAAATLPRLPAGLAAAMRANLAAARDLQRLSGPSEPVQLRLVPPPPAGRLLSDYRAAQHRFHVRWQVLAAVNLIESAFGRVVNRSSAGAQGPMQFLPATWRAYGLGGDVHAARDAILGAANYLHRSGAPADERGALHAYNPSALYVDAVLTYARAMTQHPDQFLVYYSWEADLPATLRTG
jgi:hypothetical protein